MTPRNARAPERREARWCTGSLPGRRAVRVSQYSRKETEAAGGAIVLSHVVSLGLRDVVTEIRVTVLGIVFQDTRKQGLYKCIDLARKRGRGATTGPFAIR